MKKLIPILILIFLLTPLVPIQAATLSSQFSTLVKNEKLSLAKQSVCIEGVSGESIVSRNKDMRIIPASVSKLYTFDWALSTLPVDFRYETEFVLNGKTLYVNGAADPHFVIEHLRDVLKKVTTEQRVTINKLVVTNNFYFNWRSTPASVQAMLVKSFTQDPTLPVSPNSMVTSTTTPYVGSGVRYTFRSIPLTTIMKQINNYSTNISADMLFKKLGGAEAFSNYMQQQYGVGSETVRFETGSGLSGNYTTCGLTLRVIEHLEENLKQKGLKITDVISVPMVDPGILEKRTIDSTLAKSMVAKSGFLNRYHALAGAINTKDGSMYYGIFTYYPNLAKGASVKNMIDKFVNEVLKANNAVLVPFDYVPDPSKFMQVEVVRG